MHAINEIKSLIFDVLEMSVQSGDVKATQQMGVSMSNAVKRDGVVIIQNQNVEVLTRIIPSLVKTLKLCDSIELGRNQIVHSEDKQVEQTVIEMEPKPLQLSPPDEETDPIERCCDWLYENHIKWLDMQDVMKARYLTYVVDRFKTKTEAAKWLGVGPAYLCKLTKENK